MDATYQNTNTDAELIHQYSFDRDETDSIVVAVSNAVSEVTGTPMEEMPPLQETLDCDALESLFDSFNIEDMSELGQVGFSFHGCTIRIDTTGTIQVYDGNYGFTPDSSRC